MEVRFLDDPGFTQAVRQGELFDLFCDGDPEGWKETLSQDIDNLTTALDYIDEDLCYVRNEHWSNNSIWIEIHQGVVGRAVIEHVLAFLRHSACVCAGLQVSENSLLEVPCVQIGRVAIRLDGITVEDTIRDWWISNLGREGFSPDARASCD